MIVLPCYLLYFARLGLLQHAINHNAIRTSAVARQCMPSKTIPIISIILIRHLNIRKSLGTCNIGKWSLLILLLLFSVNRDVNDVIIIIHSTYIDR